MVEVTITIPADKIDRVITAFKGLYGIPSIPDPEWVESEETPEAELVPEYTDNEWPKARTIQFIKDTVRRYEESKAKSEVSIDASDVAN